MSCELNNIYDFCILQNQTFTLPLTLRNDDGTLKDLSAWSFTGSIKEKTTDRVPSLFFTCSVALPVSGTLSLYLSADTTWALTGSKYVYDLIGNNTAVSPVETTRLMQGKITIKPGVTEP